MNQEYYKSQVKCLIELVRAFKYCVSVMAPEGWQKEYLRNMCKCIINLQRCILQFDTYNTFLRFFPSERYKLAIQALKYDVFNAFRVFVAKHEDIVNDTFLFVE